MCTLLNRFIKSLPRYECELHMNMYKCSRFMHMFSTNSKKDISIFLPRSHSEKSFWSISINSHFLITLHNFY